MSDTLLPRRRTPDGAGLRRGVARMAATLLASTAVALAAAVGAPVQAAAYAGYLNDPSNAALVGSALDAPSFADDWATSNNVALHVLDVLAPGEVVFRSTGFAAGGVDPYFSLFSGTTGDAQFVASNHATAFNQGGDFSLAVTLAPGAYTLAIGAYANLSFAENLGGGTLADGFIGLGQPALLGNTYYEMDVTALAAPIPEPASALLFLVAGGLFAVRRVAFKTH